MNTRTRTLSEASDLINGDRQRDYGTPQVNFKRIADRWSQIVGRQLEPWEVAHMLIDLKMARLVNGPHDDSWRDLCGYAGLGAELSEDV